MKILGFLGLLLIVMAMVSFTVSAGVGFSKEIQIYPKQTLTSEIYLQNLNGDDPDLKFIGSILEGDEYVSFKGGNEFVVPNGEIENAPIRIRLPRDSRIGDRFKVRMKFSTEELEKQQVDEEREGATVRFTKGYGISFDIVVVEEPPQESPPIQKSTLLIIVWIVAFVLVALILFFWKRSKKKEAVTNTGNVSGVMQQKDF